MESGDKSHALQDDVKPSHQGQPIASSLGGRARTWMPSSKNLQTSGERRGGDKALREPLRRRAVRIDMKPDTFSFASSRGGGGDRKTLQLCSQVADTLNYVLSGECNDELLQNMQVISVVPAPNASQLLVTVSPITTTGSQFNASDVHQRLTRAVGGLRSEVAASITRKKAPGCCFKSCC